MNNMILNNIILKMIENELEGYLILLKSDREIENELEGCLILLKKEKERKKSRERQLKVET